MKSSALRRPIFPALVAALLILGAIPARAASRSKNLSNLPIAAAHKVTIVAKPADALALEVPGGVHANDVLIAQVSVSGSSAISTTPPAGWTLVRRDDSSAGLAQFIYFHIVPPTPREPAKYSWVFSSPAPAAGGIADFYNANRAGPIDASNGQANSAGQSMVAPSVSIPIAHGGDLVVNFFATATGSEIDEPPNTSSLWRAMSTRGGLAIAASEFRMVSGGSSPAQTATSRVPVATIGAQVAITAHAPLFAGVNQRTSANAPGEVVSGNLVTVYVPFGSDDNGSLDAARVAVENGGNPLPPAQVISTDNVNSCSPVASGEVVCSGTSGTIDLISAGATSAAIVQSGAVDGNSYTGGFCVGCGAMVDDALGLGVVSTGDGFVDLNLADNSVSPPIFNNGEPVSVNFGYDPVHHRILSANYEIVNTQTFASSSPHFQIIDISGSPARVYELANDQSFFINRHEICGSQKSGRAFRLTLPDDNAIDTSTNIALVTFHSPSACFSDPPQDIGLFDLSQATFTPGNPAGLWDTQGKQVETLEGLNQNRITGISVVSGTHLALVADQFASNKFSVLQLPPVSGSGIPAMVDWVGSAVPADPDGKSWQMWHQPNGLTSYVSPLSGRAMGVIMNNGTDASGNPSGPIYLAIIDLQAVLDAPRSPTDPHTISPSVDLIGGGIIRYVKVQ